MMARPSLALLAAFLLALWATATLAAPDPAPRDVVIDWAVPITMRDGVKLNANIYRPAAGPARLPVVLTITPYTIDTLHEDGNFFASHGYVYVAVDTRGRGGSQGDFMPTTHEAADGVDTIDWIAHQSFSDGRVVMWGGSYAGRNQLVIAAQRPSALKAIAPAATGYYGVDRGMRANIPFPQQMTWMALVAGRTAHPNAYIDRNYWVGAMAELAAGRTSFRHFDQLVDIASQLWQANLAHPMFDAYWMNTTGDASALTARRKAT